MTNLLYDFECRSCGNRFEKFASSDVHMVKCPIEACEDQAVRMLGGRPITNRVTNPVQERLTEMASASTFPPLIVAGANLPIEPGVPARLPTPPNFKPPPGTPILVLNHAHDEQGECQDKIGFGMVTPGQGKDA